MTAPEALTVSSETPQFRGSPIRSVLFDGVPWFYLSDLCAALRRSSENPRIVDRLDFPQFARRSHMDDQEGAVVVVSPIGAFYVIELLDKYSGQALAAWTRRESQRLCPNPAPNDPAMFLTILPDRCLPPRPAKYSGRFAEWDALQCTPEGSKAVGRWPAHYAPVYDRFRAEEAAIMERIS